MYSSLVSTYARIDKTFPFKKYEDVPISIWEPRAVASPASCSARKLLAKVLACVTVTAKLYQIIHCSCYSTILILRVFHCSLVLIEYSWAQCTAGEAAWLYCNKPIILWRRLLWSGRCRSHKILANTRVSSSPWQYISVSIASLIYRYTETTP